MTQPWPGRSLPDVLTTYVLCTEDTLPPPPRQRVMAARLGVEPIEIASDHAVFTLLPHELAAILAGQGGSRVAGIVRGDREIGDRRWCTWRAHTGA
jgi:hypothetical protein